MQNFLIIGGSSGIGNAVVNQLVAHHNVWTTYHNHPTTHDKAKFFEYHVDKDLDTTSLPEELHGVVYCPGAIVLKPFNRINEDQFLQDYQLQVIGAIKTLQQILPKLKAADQASVVFFSTVAVQTGFPFHSLVSASKGAIEGLTRALAAELAPKIRVNCIAPSLTDTPLAASILNTADKIEANAQRHPLKRIGQATDIANAVCFLLEQKTAWMTGQILKVDGGISSLKI